jgi:hypothetical protein
LIREEDMFPRGAEKWKLGGEKLNEKTMGYSQCGAG